MRARPWRGGASLTVVVLLLILGCMGCCCGGIPLFGLWPELDEAEVEAALGAQPIVVDHVCRADLDCERVRDVEVALYPLSYSLVTKELLVLTEVEATCTQRKWAPTVPGVIECAGLAGAVYVAADVGWDLAFVTESTAGAEPSGVRLEPGMSGGGGDWDD